MLHADVRELRRRRCSGRNEHGAGVGDSGDVCLGNLIIRLYIEVFSEYPMSHRSIIAETLKASFRFFKNLHRYV